MAQPMAAATPDSGCWRARRRMVRHGSAGFGWLSLDGPGRAPSPATEGAAA